MKPAESTFVGRTFPEPFPPLCASAWGDDRYGLWCEIEVGGVVQRLRWIEPGEFWMGSTEAERERFGEQGDDKWKKWIQNEAPRHRVKLTRGFWLADTACTQALWQAVVGDTPSHFTGEPQLPVEQVSWDTVDASFLPKLQLRLGVSAAVSLPTEVEWEYACRAGTETAFYFGEQILSDQVNYDGNQPSPGGSAVQFRERTLPVKALPANSWGLYQMHGNVREWCADALRTYLPEQEVDPDGGQDSRSRAMRGGTWIDAARRARSAYRYGYRRGSRSQGNGFRFALRSIEPSAGGGTQAGAEAGGAR